MKNLIPLFSLSLFLVTAAGAENLIPRTVTPFGASCPLCSGYGYCDKPLSYEEGSQTLKAFFSAKGMAVVINKKDGRFIEADVMKDGKIVDKVILDCRTGRIRSIY